MSLSIPPSTSFYLLLASIYCRFVRPSPEPSRFSTRLYRDSLADSTTSGQRHHAHLINCRKACRGLRPARAVDFLSHHRRATRQSPRRLADWRLLMSIGLLSSAKVYGIANADARQCRPISALLRLLIGGFRRFGVIIEPRAEARAAWARRLRTRCR